MLLRIIEWSKYASPSYSVKHYWERATPAKRLPCRYPHEPRTQKWPYLDVTFNWRRLMTPLNNRRAIYIYMPASTRHSAACFLRRATTWNHYAHHLMVGRLFTPLGKRPTAGRFSPWLRHKITFTLMSNIADTANKKISNYRDSSFFFFGFLMTRRWLYDLFPPDYRRYARITRR